jgi:hypothetical protein
MISPDEIIIKALRKYLSHLQSIVRDIPFSRMVIMADKKPSKILSELESELLDLVNHSKEKKGFGYSLDYQTVKTKTIGTQSLPTHIYFDTEHDFVKFLGKEKEVADFRINHIKITALFPDLYEWVLSNPSKIVQYTENWDGILRVCSYFKGNPKPNLYIRELPIAVHTKFIEEHQSIIKELLDIVIHSFVNVQEKEFEKRFNLKYHEPQVRFKMLDKAIAGQFFSGLDDMAIPIGQFQRLVLPIKRVLIVENKTNLYTTLTLPKMDSTLAIFGSGYSVNILKNADWLKDVELLYWGDIDVQGFEILSQVRGHFPNTRSILMDKATFDLFFENDLGTPAKIVTKPNLTDNEQQVYDIVCANNWRLEQEKIPWKYVNDCFEMLNVRS